MFSAPLKVLLPQIQSPQFSKIFRPQSGELIQQLCQRLALTLTFLSPAIERLKSFCLAKLQDHPRPRHPIGALAMNEVPDDIEGGPGILTFIAKRPSFRQIAKKRIERGRSASQERYRILQIMLHYSPQAEL